jgi:hypothetical protein
MIPRLIGITGKAGVGKDTLANQFVSLLGYERYALANPIKELLNARFGWTMALWDYREWKEAPGIVYGGYSPRSWAQWLGTEVGRTFAGEDVWANLMRQKYADLCLRHPGTAAMVVPDVRFDNEARMIRSLGGRVVEVWRDGVAPVTAHKSEQGVSRDLIDVGVGNISTPHNLYLAACRMLESF